MSRFVSMKGQLAVAVIVISLILIGGQALVWRHSTHRAASETQKIDLETEHPPTELPGLAGLTLLCIAAGLLSVPGSGAE
jgi:hypothetical protein